MKARGGQFPSSAQHSASTRVSVAEFSPTAYRGKPITSRCVCKRSIQSTDHTRYLSMTRRARLSVSLAILGIIATGWNLLLFAVENRNRGVADIVARARLFSELGPGLHALKRDSGGRYYVLAAPATTIYVYGADGKRAGQIPAANSQSAKIVFADDIDID